LPRLFSFLAEMAEIRRAFASTYRPLDRSTDAAAGAGSPRMSPLSRPGLFSAAARTAASTDTSSTVSSTGPRRQPHMVESIEVPVRRSQPLVTEPLRFLAMNAFMLPS
jgi:hypothetical protein